MIDRVGTVKPSLICGMESLAELVPVQTDVAVEITSARLNCSSCRPAIRRSGRYSMSVTQRYMVKPA
jgi:hypothetical protein